MRDRSHFATLIALCFLTIAIGVLGLACGKMEGNNTNTTASPTPTPDPCAAVKDGTIVDSIYGKLIKDPDIFPVIKQINVTATAGAVTVTGWVNGATIATKVLDIVKSAACVKSVDSSQFYDHTPNPTQPDSLGACGPGLIRCGDICVPDHCFWTTDAPSPVATNSNTKPATNSSSTPGNNTNTKSNSNSNSNSNSKY